jgi:hypothetical protein
MPSPAVAPQPSIVPPASPPGTGAVYPLLLPLELLSAFVVCLLVALGCVVRRLHDSLDKLSTMVHDTRSEPRGSPLLSPAALRSDDTLGDALSPSSRASVEAALSLAEEQRRLRDAERAAADERIAAMQAELDASRSASSRAIPGLDLGGGTQGATPSLDVALGDSFDARLEGESGEAGEAGEAGEGEEAEAEEVEGEEELEEAQDLLGQLIEERMALREAREELLDAANEMQLRPEELAAEVALSQAQAQAQQYTPGGRGHRPSNASAARHAPPSQARAHMGCALSACTAAFD